jgi:hypothetical protein
MRWGIRVAIIVAATLSVAAIPVAVSAIGVDRASTIATVVSIAIAVVTFLFSLVTYRVVWHREDSSGDSEGNGKVFRVDGGLQAELDLMTELSMIEADARNLLGSSYGSSIFSARVRLRESEIWSDQDVSDFDDALRTRNQIAHGDDEMLNTALVAGALETMRRLRRKLETAR